MFSFPGFSYAGVEYSKECHCALNIPANISNLSLPQHLCDSKCPANSSQTCGGYYALDVFQTGFSEWLTMDGGVLEEDDGVSECRGWVSEYLG